MASKRHNREYQAWCNMISRCTNPDNPKYAYYGGRGIAICRRWRHSFDNFISDMGPRPTPKHELERINNNLGYKPGNCKWATRKEQCRNFRRNRMITAFGFSLCLEDWSIASGIGAATLSGRLNRGWTPEQALIVVPVPTQIYTKRKKQ